MPTFFFLVASSILLALNIYAAIIGYPEVGFGSAVLWLAAAVTGRDTKNNNIVVFWGCVGLSVVFAGLGVLGLFR